MRFRLPHIPPGDRKRFRCPAGSSVISAAEMPAEDYLPPEVIKEAQALGSRYIALGRSSFCYFPYRSLPDGPWEFGIKGNWPGAAVSTHRHDAGAYPHHLFIITGASCRKWWTRPRLKELTCQ